MEPYKNPLELAALASAALPGLQVVSVLGEQAIGDTVSATRVGDSEGNFWNVVAYRTNFQDWQLGVIQQSYAALHQLGDAGVLPFAVPRLEGVAPCGPTGFVEVLTVTAGRPIREAELSKDGLLAASLGRALAALHNVSPTEFDSLRIERYTPDQIRAHYLEMLASVGREVGGRLRKRWLTALREDVLWNFDPTPVHGQLTSNSILIGGGAVLSLTDFEALSIGDPALDLSWLLPVVSDQFLDRMSGSYSLAQDRTDLHIFTRAQLHSELALLDWLRESQEEGDRDAVAQAVQMMTELEADLAGAMLVNPTRPVVEVNFEAADEPLNRIARASHVTELETQEHSPEPALSPDEVATTSLSTGEVLAPDYPTPNDPVSNDPAPAETDSLRTESAAFQYLRAREASADDRTEAIEYPDDGLWSGVELEDADSPSYEYPRGESDDRD
ncbi:phosphotransferase [Scrofimicrobium sp. R131]|uniref:Phosphotransferase n=1 Tax=Scrofimicrobium appendicitidis TaxID=3079930 RepID=A0AAU7VB92_9ACTO